MSRKVLDSEPNENIWTKRLNWVKARDASKNKYERFHYNLKIAYYDYEVARRYGNVGGKKNAWNRIKSLKKNVINSTFFNCIYLLFFACCLARRFLYLCV
jgi:hypothetical protein